jgi:hypothetical protein
MSCFAYYELYHNNKARRILSLVENRVDIIAVEKETKLIKADRERG